MRILLFGSRGQVGWELQRALAPVGEVVALDRAGRDGLSGDLQDTEGLARTVRGVAPDVVVNAAAFTNVDKAEAEPDLAHRINAEAPAVLARECERLGAWLVHYSTDYVFDGSGGDYRREDAPVAPINVYGTTKAAAERAVVASGCRHLLFRTGWVYAARGRNFARTMLRLAGERDALSVVADQIGAPTGAELIADVSAQVLRSSRHTPDLSGCYHLVASGETSWCDYARFLIQAARGHGMRLQVSPGEVSAISSEDYPTPARRPKNSRLDTGKLRETFGLELPDWRFGVERMVMELLENAK